MGELIEYDFQNRKVIARSDGDIESEPASLRVVKTREEASREELIDQAATVAAAYDMARARGDELEEQDLAITLRDCMAQVGENDREEVYILATKKLDDQPLRTGRLKEE